MEENKELKVTDLRVGDKVRAKNTGYEFVVTGIFWNLGAPKTEATLHLDFEENTGSVFEFELDEVELAESHQ